MDNMKHRRLQELGRSDFDVVEGQPNIKGWDVKLSSGDKVGEVDELIIDAQQRRVRYIVLDMDDNDIDLDDRKVLIPIGLAQLHKDDDDVLLPAVSKEQLRALPEYREDYLTDEVEQQISQTLGRSGSERGGIMEDSFYDDDFYNDDNLYRFRSVTIISTDDNTGRRGIHLNDRRTGNTSNERGDTNNPRR
jgi:sporulation protein YlmC with PRC-barrel domain